MDVLTKRVLEREPERAADETDADDGKLCPVHARRPTAGAIWRTSSISCSKLRGTRL